MPKKYKGVCLFCKKFYEGRGEKFCSADCHRDYNRKIFGKDLPDIDDTEFPIFNQQLEIHGDTIVTADWQLPYYNREFAEIMLAIAEKQEIKNILIAGDFFNQDSYSRHLNKMVVQFSREREVAFQLIKSFTKFFDKIFISIGNHDERLWKLLLKVMNEQEAKFISDQILWGPILEELKEKVVISDYFASTVNDKWLVVHPESYSKIVNRVAYQLVAKYRTSVISAHGHMAGVSHDQSGRNEVIDIGGMFDKDRIEYRATRVTTHNEWNNAFVMIKKSKLDGEYYSHLIRKGFTDYEFYL